MGQTIGGIIAGIEGQIFRSTPPAHELVRKGDAVRGMTGQDGGELTIELPPESEEAPADPTTPAAPEPDVSSGGPRRSR